MRALLLLARSSRDAMLGHDDIAEDIETIVGSRLFERIYEESSRRGCVEVGSAPIATERDEMVVSESVESLEVKRHGRIVDPRVGLRPMPTLVTMKPCRRWGTWESG